MDQEQSLHRQFQNLVRPFFTRCLDRQRTWEECPTVTDRVFKVLPFDSGTI